METDEQQIHERRTATILFADIVSYSQLMGKDETATLHALQAHRFALIDPTIGQFEGRIVKLLGDGILAEFPDVIKAVNCAAAIQKGMIKRNEDVGEDMQIRFRMGINMGEIIVADDDIYGDGVNIASRLQEIAEPECIAISSKVFGLVDGEVDHEFEDIGAHQLKNIERPIRVFHYAPSGVDAEAKHAFRPFIDMPEEKPTVIKGGCMCGRIRYEINDKPLGSMMCHCSMCQKFSGAPAIAGTTFVAEKVKWTKGAPRFYESSKIAKRGFCPDCGTSLVYQGLIGIWTKWTLVFTASVDEPAEYRPTYHMGVESMMPWMEIHDDLPRTMSKDSPSLVDAYGAVGEDVP